MPKRKKSPNKLKRDRRVEYLSIEKPRKINNRIINIAVVICFNLVKLSIGLNNKII